VSRAPSRARPTRYADLNELLGELVDGASEALGDDFVGAYLVGSFALGAADEWSDADFIVVTERRLADEEPIRQLHAELFDRPTRWAHHLEGSYAPRAILRNVDPERTPFFFLDHGSRELVWDDHCNTALVRWTLRNHGVTLAGPDPRDLVEPVAPDDLRNEARRFLGDFADWAQHTDMNRWRQSYIVLSVCRMRCTLATATVVSKQAAAEWALDDLDDEWHDLIRAALAERPDPVPKVFQPPDPRLAERTRAFAEAMR
jgi:aminoglycoside adenylyltransferase-like protein/nucleotidyltransferase-like protein